MTDSEVANQSFQSKANFSKALSGKRLPTWETVRAILQACGTEDEQEWYSRWKTAQGSREECNDSPQERVPLCSDDSRAADVSGPTDVFDMAAFSTQTPTVAAPPVDLQAPIVSPDDQLSDRRTRRSSLILALALLLLVGAVAAGLFGYNHWRNRLNGTYLATGTQNSCNLKDCDTSRETTLFLYISGCPDNCVVTGVSDASSVPLTSSGKDVEATGAIEKDYEFQCDGQNIPTVFTMRLTVPEFQPKELWGRISLSGTFENSATGEGSRCKAASISWAIVAAPS